MSTGERSLVDGDKFQNKQELRIYQARNKLVYENARTDIEEHTIMRESIRGCMCKSIIDGRYKSEIYFVSTILPKCSLCLYCVV